MNEFDKIIGYSDIKRELEQLADILRGNETYRKLGVKSPHGLLLHGDPGLGKTLMANCLIKASGRTTFICRKDLPNGEFVKAIRETFCKAKDAAPSIVFLDDMDKFANGDENHPDAEEYVTVQSCIDETRDCDVFVVATVNRLHLLPDSLLRAGRFDRTIAVDTPGVQDGKKIIAHYMKTMAFDGEVDVSLITRLMKWHSCAELETVLNEAGLYAGFDRTDTITEKHFLKAYMRMAHDVLLPETQEADETNSQLKRWVACHEAGHAVICEALDPGSVSLAAIYREGENYSGFVTTESQSKVSPTKETEHSVLVSLGGKAATEHLFGECDLGSSKDIKEAIRLVRRAVCYNASFGFGMVNQPDNSEQLKHKQEIAVATRLEEYFQQAKKLILDNQALWEQIMTALLDKGILTMRDIQRIKNELSGGHDVA